MERRDALWRNRTSTFPTETASQAVLFSNRARGHDGDTRICTSDWTTPPRPERGPLVYSGTSPRSAVGFVLRSTHRRFLTPSNDRELGSKQTRQVHYVSLKMNVANANCRGRRASTPYSEWRPLDFTVTPRATKLLSPSTYSIHVMSTRMARSVFVFPESHPRPDRFHHQRPFEQEG